MQHFPAKSRAFSEREHEYQFKFLRSLIFAGSIARNQARISKMLRNSLETNNFSLKFLLKSSVSQENQGLHTSLEKNLVEIKHLALSKLVRHLNRNLETIDTQLIIKSLDLLRNHQELYQKFLKNYLKYRKFVNSQLLDPFLQNFIEPVPGFKAASNEFLVLLQQEIEFLQGSAVVY